ncbi:hypothetical protein L2E82_52363 [Cichorium intybus]|nr:hypothetical protein L2E82_52363 [Cichorium intybus]
MRDTRSAKVLVQMFRVLLNLCKINTNSDTDKAHMDEHGKPQVEMHWAWELQGNLRKMMALLQEREIVELETCPMMEQLRIRYRGRLETHPIIAFLQEIQTVFERIERLITALSASKRALMQRHFLSLCEEAAILANNMLGWMKSAK